MNVLFICAQNMFRSIVAESSFRFVTAQILEDKSSVLRCSSCGLNQEKTSPVYEECEIALKELNIPQTKYLSKGISERKLADSDIVLTMTREQLFQLETRFPGQKSKCFSLVGANGAIETILMENKNSMEREEIKKVARNLQKNTLDKYLEEAANLLCSTPRSKFRPLPGVDLTVSELMGRFSSCFRLTSGIQDPIGGTKEETIECAKKIHQEVENFIYGILAIAIEIGEELPAARLDASTAE
ncbi:MAG: hypothetical protein PHO53_03635 [Actinomycetota bacterium]|nr:hypothetical protein [Actinomycetota bacterium]